MEIDVKKLLLLLSLISGLVGSSIAAQSPMTLYGLNLETDPYIVAETLHSDMRLTCADDYAWTIDELLEFRGKFVTCMGRDFDAVSTNEYFPEVWVPVVSFRVHETQNKLTHLVFHCALYNFCVVGPGTTRIAEKLIDERIVPRLTPQISQVRRVVGTSSFDSGDTYTMFGREFKSKSYASDTVLETNLNYCFLNFRFEQSLCVMQNPAFEPPLMEFNERTGQNWYELEWGPVIVLQEQPVQFVFQDKIDFGGGTLDHVWDEENYTILRSMGGISSN
jgi:hypothetical protein